MSAGAWWRGLLGEERPKPPAILTEEQAVERVKRYAADHGYAFPGASSIELKRRKAASGTGFEYVYTMALGTRRPGVFVDVAAADGEVLAWHALPR